MNAAEPEEPGRQAIIEAFERHGVEYVVIGGVAAQSRGWREATADIDVTPERSQGNLARLAAAMRELGAGFRVDPERYRDGFHPPGGIDWRTFRNQVSVALTTRHGHLDVVLFPDGTKGYEDIAATATRERLLGTEVVVPVASAEAILRSKEAAGRQKDREQLPRMRAALDGERLRGRRDPGRPPEYRDPWGLPNPRDLGRTREGREPPER